MAVLTAFMTTSCKKAYECTCDHTDSYSYSAIMSQWQDDVDIYNNAITTDPLDTETSVTTLEKTTKADANTVCANTVNSYTNEYPDTGDQDLDGNTQEAAYSRTDVNTIDCSLEKK